MSSHQRIHQQKKVEGVANISLNMADEIVYTRVNTRPTIADHSGSCQSVNGRSFSSSTSSNSATTNTITTLSRSISSPPCRKSSTPIMSAQYHRNLESYATTTNNNNLGSCHTLCRGNGISDKSNMCEHKQTRCIEISRNVLDSDTFDHRAQRRHINERNSSDLMVENKSTFENVCGNCSLIGCARSLFPIIDWLPKYSIKSDLLPDLISGITISILHIPQGIAYSLLAGLGPVNGLYVSFFPVLIYVLMGTSPHISIGTFAIASIMLNNIAMKMGAQNGPIDSLSSNSIIEIGNNVNLTSNLNQPFMNESLIEDGTTANVIIPLQTIEVLTSVGLLCGFIQLAMGFLRLGSLSLILSEYLVSAFSTAIAFHVATSQFVQILGFENLPRTGSGPFKLIRTWIIMYEHANMTNLNSIIFSFFMILILFTFKEWIEPMLKKRNSFPIPIDLLMVIFAILLSWLFKFNQTFDIQVVKHVPTGLPKPAVPRLDLMPAVFVDSLILSIVCFAVSLSLAKIFAKKHGYRVDPNQELVALGSANVFSSFFLSYPSSAALSRSTLQEKVGGRTQIAGLVSCAIILTVLLLLAPFLYHLPKCALSCIILVALKSMFMQIKDLPTFWRISKLDGTVWFVTFSSVIILDIDLGLIIGISISIFSLLIRLAIPRMNWLGQFATTEIYAEIDAYRDLSSYPGLKIVRFGSPLFYLNVEVFKDRIMAEFPSNIGIDLENCDAAKETLSHEKRALIIDLSGVSFIDKPGIDALVEVIRSLQEQEIITCLATCPYHIVDSLHRAHFSKRIENISFPCRMYPTIHDAVIDSL
ncbi:hypothetical protein BLOT_001327 [Blomia tropicalis]|nr:hypothetical protein BLOT_001327 [Blomia tropicalis]